MAQTRATRPRRRFVDGRFGQLHVRTVEPEQPARTPLYCVHQSPSSSLIYVPLLETLGIDRLAAAGDTPGFGESDKPDSMPEVSDYASAHGEIIDAIGMQPPYDLVGYYTGSKIAVELALQRPEAVRRLVLFGAVIYTDEELAEEQHLYRPDEYRWDASHLMGWWQHLRRGAPEDYPIELFVRHFAEIQRGGPDSWWGHRAAFRYDLRAKLPALEQPVLLICAHDPQGEKSRRALEYLKNGTLVEFPYRVQGMLDLHTEEVCAALRDFLDRDT
jgi:pimeloyl-ACP methyl ester carboxylesterase